MSTLLADTIRKTGGTAGVDIRIKNTSVYESDGGTSVTQNLVQGLTKHWINYDMASATPRDSLNTSSLVDNDVGQWFANTTNAFSTLNYCINMTTNSYAGDSFQLTPAGAPKTNLGTDTTSKYGMWVYANGAYADAKYNYLLGHGDLA
tara:strand:- start:42 stop:485 length:444 start_codon:yes stop_codon:yes gene_type:complete